jgi:Golgi phosphoprotein 3 GPP34
VDCGAAGHAARTALLIDLACRGRLTRYVQTTVVDTTPTGFPPADRLLAHIDNHPDHTMQRVLGRARVGMSDVVDP